DQAAAASLAAGDESPPPSSLDALARDPVTRSLLASLQNLLARRDARAREALLAFKDDAAYRRFLARAQKAGLTVLGQLDGLRTVRVRAGSFAALQADLLQNSADYAAVSPNYTMNIPGPPAKDPRAAVDQVPFGNRALQFLGVTGDHSQWGNGVTIAILDT